MRSALPQIDPPTLPELANLGTRTHCPYCAFQCGTVLTLDPPARPSSGETDGTITPTVRIQGDPDFPVNAGKLCIKGWTAGELLRHPQRVLQPQIRGRDGRWQRATWEAALDLVAERLQRIQQQHGTDAVGVFGSGVLTNEKAYLLGKFARLALNTPHIDYNGRYCMSSAAAAGNKAFGIDRGLPFPVGDLVLAETLLIVGSNPLETLPPMVQWLDQQQELGGRLIVVDPRRTATAQRAQLHLAVTPGADLALANGLLYLAIEENLVDRNFLTNRTTGWDAVRRTVLDYPPVQVERLTGISESAMRQTVRWLAKPNRGLILTGRGTEQHAKGVDSVLAWINLALALGHVGEPGSGFGTLTGQGNGQGGREHGQKADQLPGYRLIEIDAHREHVARVWGVDPASLPRKGRSAVELLDSLGQPNGIHGLLVMGSNVAVASPDLPRIHERLRSLSFLAVCDLFDHETAQFADVLLPVTQWAEEDGTMTNFEGRVIRRRTAIAPPPGVRTDGWILSELAQRFGQGDRFRYDSTEAIFDELCRATAGGVADYAGMSYARIEQSAGLFWPCPHPAHPGTPRLFADRFFHADGKAKLHPVQHRPAGEEPDSDYPIYFTTGRDLEHYNSGTQTRRSPTLAGKKPMPRLQIHPDLAAEHGIVAGCRVTIASRRSAVEFLAEITRNIRPDTLFAPFHWGGRDAANLLTQATLDPTSRMPEFKLAAVRIVAVQPAIESFQELES
ncbi:molybdopterin oxidoreductase family protein [Tuwongella immobilis]|uniref:4Fe-4S Mo/W bis-MGD-type domain-containing protein n=1 Tax=Tuwongella immobilis TaxID=692036 RepID=A0A6C2YJ28_9BACT|nr:molybdopterin oxidoreductase family protein [Tuwongella immobilis]VIP00982.1 molybdopterin oxidoreductase : Nitrite reductase OS=Sorangium cellulosum So0157-2 GN=SCE1572_21180 PE=4 SV=1: Molybdop_Fe4S4: Molybdopterin: Molydop_binding [Tuwongella immobilis]VTR97382.1 molybdopterin oxidoreductase : Nitrite reductase OS=Sorangium cellulosum So0157-2 GN=SCE1572_21180 PE=4 SV=1: Molybdop_Fe4S4: Molybdopterin: Molydop_binding [Tuwongella immobilis]